MFISIRQFRLRFRLFFVIVGMLVSVYVMLSLLLYYDQYNRLTKNNHMTMEQYNADVHLLLDLYLNERHTKIREGLHNFDKALEARGGVKIKENIYTVRASNELTQATYPITISEWQVGKNRIDKEQVFLDSLSKVLGCELSIFQKIPQGMLRVSTTLKSPMNERRVNMYLPNESEMVQNVNEGRHYIGRILLNKTWHIVNYQPIKQGNRVIGMLATSLPERDFTYLVSLLSKRKYLQTGHIYFFSPDGTVLLHRDSTARRMNLAKTMPDLLHLAGKQKIGSYRYYANFGKKPAWRWQYYSYYKRADFYTAIAVSENEFIDMPLNEVRNLLIGVFMLFLVVAIVVVYVFSNIFTQPFSVIAKTLGNLAAGKKTYPLAYKRKDEVGSISQSLNQLIHTSEGYASFAKAVGEGKFSQSFEVIGSDDVLANALLQMRDDLQKTAEEEATRNWITAQNAHFSEVIRQNQDDRTRLAQGVLGTIMQRLGMVQGAFYHVDKEEGETALVLISAYAYHRQKLLQARFNTKDGLLGEAYQNKRVIEVHDLAEGYLKLLSGVGEQSPSYLLIMPCQTNTEVLGLLELASFQPLEAFKIDFLKELTNTIGSTLSNIRTSELTVRYLREAQEASEQLRQQDEELRQNMEELAASHEHMRQQEQEIRKLLKKSQAKEEILQENMAELKKYQVELQAQREVYEKRIKELEANIR
jgi:methyl-accepting chemotaxis protein